MIKIINELNPQLIDILIFDETKTLDEHFYLAIRFGNKKPKNVKTSKKNINNATHILINNKRYNIDLIYKWRALLWLKYFILNPEIYKKLRKKHVIQNNVLSEDMTYEDKEILTKAFTLGLEYLHKRAEPLIKSINFKLKIELVPSSSWGNNLRSMLNTSLWDKIRKDVYKQYKLKCGICGDVGPKHPVECHEIWSYDDTLHKQTLTGLIALCPDCHKVKHAGRTIVISPSRTKGENFVIQHLMKVNNMKYDEAYKHFADSFYEYAKRSKYEWTVDISYIIDKYNITINDITDKYKDLFNNLNLIKKE